MVYGIWYMVLVKKIINKYGILSERKGNPQ